MPVKKKEDVAIEMSEEIVTNDDVTLVPPFNQRLQQLGAHVREQAPKVLKFDSNVGNIDYDYVDTQQYKVFVGSCCDQFDIGFTWQASNPSLQIINNAQGKQVFVVMVDCVAGFIDKFSDATVEYSACGMGTSFGNNYAMSIAQTNAMRNFLTNAFLMPTNDRDTDDMKSRVSESAAKYLTDGQKAEERKARLEATKSSAEYATLAMGNVIHGRLIATLEKELPEEFKTKLQTFLNNKFEDGKPKPLADNPKNWIVKKVSAAAIMSELDNYND